MNLFGQYGLPWFTFLGHTYTKAEVIVLSVIAIHVAYKVLKYDIPWDKRIHKYDKPEPKKEENTNV